MLYKHLAEQVLLLTFEKTKHSTFRLYFRQNQIYTMSYLNLLFYGR